MMKFYISCAQVKVTGGGTTTPAPTVSIPGAFKSNDPGYTANIYNGGAQSYVVPGPKVVSSPLKCRTILYTNVC
jgi:hypothetical protein